MSESFSGLIYQSQSLFIKIILCRTNPIGRGDTLSLSNAEFINKSGLFGSNSPFLTISSHLTTKERENTEGSIPISFHPPTPSATPLKHHI